MVVPSFKAVIAGFTLGLASLAGGVLAGQSDQPAAHGNPEAAKLQNPVPATPDSLAAGKGIFEDNCSRCHGPNAKGGPPIGTVAPPDLTDDQWKYGSSDGEIFNTIQNGVPAAYLMQPWGDLFKDTDLWNVLNYVRSLAVNNKDKN